MKALVVTVLGLALAGCVGGGEERPVVAQPIPFQTGAGLNAVLGHDANQLVRLFGQPNADVREGPGRKLQFGSQICVLDAYLYPRGNGAQVVTHVDARQTDGSPIDKASCVAAIQRRSGGK
jgi:hypothetical protein